MHWYNLVEFLLIISSMEASPNCQKCPWDKRDNNYVYTCENGQWIAASCVTPWDRNTLVNGGQTYTLTNGQTMYECGRLSDTELQLRAVACVTKENRIVRPMETVTINGYAFTCLRQNLMDLKLQMVNVDSQKPVKSLARVPMADPAVAPAEAGEKDTCTFNGKQYPHGSDIQISGAWYTCDRSQSRLIGCVNTNGQKYRFGDRYAEKFFAFKCEQMGGTAVINGYACIERYPNGIEREFEIGQRWLVGPWTRNSRYIMQCGSDGVNNIRRRAVLCFFNTTHGTGVLTQGCMKMVGDVLVQCMPTSKAWPNVRVRVKENPTSGDQRKIESEGQLKYCESMPLPNNVIY